MFNPNRVPEIIPEETTTDMEGGEGVIQDPLGDVAQEIVQAELDANPELVASLMPISS